MASAKTIVAHLKSLANPHIAAHSQRFFKTGPGEYGEGDRFLGIRVPHLRQTAKAHPNLPLSEIESLLHSPFHEIRLTAVILLANRFKKADAPTRLAIYQTYLANTAFLNGWDLVDASAHLIVGPYLENDSHEKLFELAHSPSLWERRISIMATFHFIRNNRFDTTLAIADILLHDPEDLIHKSVGWMLRELGKRNLAAEESFLQKHLPSMPRTMLRYAIEKFPEPKRLQYLNGKP